MKNSHNSGSRKSGRGRSSRGSTGRSYSSSRTRRSGRKNRGRTHSRKNTSSRGRRRFAQYISPEKFINRNPRQYVEEQYEPTHTFGDFGFTDTLMQNLKKKGFIEPTRIQDEAIPHVLAGRNVIGLANTGSGKTAAFVLPIIHKLITTNSKQTVLIITPTRELAGQIDEEFKAFSAGMNLYSALCVGGVNIRPQIKALVRHPHVVIGTPGRLKDLLNQRKLSLTTTGIVVLDEADRMLDMGFQKDIEYIVDHIEGTPQSLYFSATVTPTIKELFDRKLTNPVTVSVRTSSTGEHIAQDIVRVQNEEEKLKRLTSMLNEPHFKKVLIFGEMKHSVQKLAQTLSRSGFAAEPIHGNKSQSQRQRALNAFKAGKVNILVATDVAARGLDIPEVSHVINYDQPNTHEDYIHRIGRTGRAGKGGQAYTFVH